VRTGLLVWGATVACLGSVAWVGGCAPAFGRLDPYLERRLPALRDALAGSAPASVASAGELTTLRYAVESHDGHWTYEILVGPRVYAERRVRADGRSEYAFGEDARGPWLRVRDGAPHVAGPTWRAEVRTRAAVFGLAFLEPGPRDEATMVSAWNGTWEYAYRSPGGRTVTLAIDDRTHEPRSFDGLDGFGRLSMCEDLAWGEREGRAVLVRARCFAVNGEANRALATSLRLVDVAAIDAEERPAWAAISRGRAVARPLDRVVTVPMEEQDSVLLELRGSRPDLPPAPAVLDTGAWWTILDSAAADAFGVVPTGEVPFYMEPAWLPAGSAWIGVVDRITIAGIEIDGARVLVSDELGDSIQGAGLVGWDFISRYVVEVDAPARALRIAPHALYREAPGAVRLWSYGGLREPPMVRGAIEGAEGLLVLDTGAPVDVVVTNPAFTARHPRRGGDEVWLHGYTDMRVAADYATEIDDMRIGPFAFPAMPAIARDRDRERVGSGIGLVGMGLMRHMRIAFDLRNREVRLWPGSSYQALVRAGLELDDDGGRRAARVTRVVPGGPADAARLRDNDVLLSIANRRVGGALEAERAVAAYRGRPPRLRVAREGRERSVTMALDPPFEVP